MLLLLISFIAGALTILAPCVLPLLPVIVGGSISAKGRERRRPYVIAASLAAAIIAFTLLLKVSTLFINVSAQVLDDVSGGILLALGLVTVLPELWERLVISFNWQALSQRFLGRGERARGQAGPILTGIALGPIFASCSPTYAFILASVLPRSLLSGVIYLISYSLGLVLTLLGISLAGRRYLARFSWAIDTHSWFRRLIGLLFVLIGVVVIAGKQVSVETWVANHLPFDESRVERVLLAGQNKQLKPRAESGSVLNVQPTPAPEFASLTDWINSPPLTVAGLHGKVVLVDFWTYSCINCIRSIPYVEKWYQTYHDQGLVVVGVNTPEFAFEHDPANVAAAVKRDGITYPVALDNNYDTWNAYNNDSWPADYLIDQQGDIRYVSLGEGDYPTTERAIQTLLGVNRPLTTPTSNVPITQDQTPETYFGTNREQNFEATPPLSDGTITFHQNYILLPDQWTLNGTWQVAPESITSQSGSATLMFHVVAKDVYMVAGGASNQPATVNVGLAPDVAGQYGSDAPGGNVTVNGAKLYHIVSLHKLASTTLTLTMPAGVSLYTFTFGS